MKILSQVLTASALLIVTMMISSCEKENAVTARITVMHDTITEAGVDSFGLLIFDTVPGPVTGAEVRFWAPQGSEIDTVVETDASGLAEVSFPEPLILNATVTYFNQFVDLGLIPMDEEGDVWEETVNLDE